MKIFAYDGAWHLDHIVLVGVGGTGSALARLVARMLWQRQEAGQTVPTLILIDPDHVEIKNIIRQGFAPAEVGAFKSQAIALRYSLAYGLPIERTRQRLREELNARVDEETEKAWPQINDAIAILGREQGYDLIVTSPVAYVSGRIDVTDDVLARLARDSDTPAR